MKEKFIKGLDLSELFYNEAVKPIMESNFPRLAYSAALLGEGSDVLGFDTRQSMDHDWGPRMILFLSETDHKAFREVIDQVLRQGLPAEFEGFSTNFGHNPDGTTVMNQTADEAIDHRVEITSVEAFFGRFLGYDANDEIRPVDWVSVPENNYRMLTSGQVFYDGLGRVETLREKLDYYPDEVWYYLLATQWQRISQEEHFLGRTGQVSDDLGSRLLVGRLARDLMRLCFLMEREYAPYIKWFGTAFSQLDCAGDLLPVFSAALEAETWEGRQEHLSAAYEIAADVHNRLKITDPVDPYVSPFFSRPFLVINAGRFVDAIRDQIKDPDVLALPEHLGAFDQFIDSTDALKYIDRVKLVYEI